MDYHFRNAVLLQWADDCSGYVPYIYDNGNVRMVSHKVCRGRDSAIRFGAAACKARQNLFGKAVDLLVVDRGATQPEKIDPLSISL